MKRTSGIPHVYLVPGFFGFLNLGEIYYFEHVHDLLVSSMAGLGVKAHVERVITHPTASIRQRSRLLAETIYRTAADDDSPIHLVGHSTGGLDCRMLVSPQISLGSGIDPEPIARRVRTVVTIATPHYGTPLATFFASRLGQRLLQLLTLATAYGLRFGHVPLSFLLKLGTVLVRADDVIGWRYNLIDQMFEQLLAKFTAERRRAVENFLKEAGKDPTLMMQLTPDAMDLFNAGVMDRGEVAYGAVVTRAQPPDLARHLELGLDPYCQATYTIYRMLHRRSASMPAQAAPAPSPSMAAAMKKSLGTIPDPGDNDGIVPTRSQVWGKLLAAVNADHLDVIGHFDDSTAQPPHVDWLCSGTAFNRRDFEQLWTRVVQFMCPEIERRES